MIFSLIKQSPSFYIFQKPALNEVFVPNIYQSSDNNDKLLCCLFQKAFLLTVLEQNDIHCLIRRVASMNFVSFPHRPYLMLAFTQLAFDYSNVYSECREIIKKVFSSLIDYELAQLYYLSIASQILPDLEGCPVTQGGFARESNLLRVQLLHSTLTKKEMVPWLFNLSKTLILQSTEYYQKKAIPILQKLCQNEELCKLIESFCHSLIKKEWEENSFTLLALSELIQAIVSFIPSLYPYLFCIELFVPSKNLSDSLLFYSAESIPSVLICDLHYSFTPKNLVSMCNHQERIYLSLLGSYLYLILCQVCHFLSHSY